MTWASFLSRLRDFGGLSEFRLLTAGSEAHSLHGIKRTTAASLTAFSARGIYYLVETLAGARHNRAYAAGATLRRREEQYLVDNVEVILETT
jgi:hypothetical protein